MGEEATDLTHLPEKGPNWPACVLILYCIVDYSRLAWDRNEEWFFFAS